MCTILVAWRCVPGAPLVVAANRDELVARATAPPRLLAPGPPAIAGGLDLVAGGTWMAVSADGRVAAVTNRHLGERDPDRRSRGEIPLLLLGAADPWALLDGIGAADYNPANALLASPDRLLVRHLEPGGDGAHTLGPGTHVVTVFDVDSEEQGKPRRLGALLAEAVGEAAGPAAALAAMEALLADHGADGGAGLDAACVHGDVYGTVSSSSVVVAEGGRVTYRHAPGRPCATPRDDLGGLLQPGG